MSDYEIKNTEQLFSFLQLFGVDLFKLVETIKLRDKFDHVWEIKKLEFDEKNIIIRLGNKGTENYTSIILNNQQCEDDFQSLLNWEIVD